MKSLLEKTKAMRERLKTLETVPGSGYYSEDSSLPPASQHLICFADERGDVYFSGDDAVKAEAAICSCRDALKQQPLSSLTGTERKIIEYVAAGRVKIVPIDGVPHLRLWGTIWNDCLHAIYKSGHGLNGPNPL